MKIFLDTNFIIGQFVHRIDLLRKIEDNFGKCEVIAPSTVISELSAIGGGRGKWAGVARAALGWLEEKIKGGEIKKEKTKEGVDSWLRANVRKGNIVLTNDGALGKVLKSKGIKILTLRQLIG